MRPEDKDAADNQMGMRSIGSKSGSTGSTAGVSMTDEDKSGLPEGTGPDATPDTKAYTNAPNVAAVPVNKSRGTGVQINNNAMDADQANPIGDGIASAISKVTKVTGDKEPGMNYGPSIGRFDNPPAAIKRTGTEDSVEDAASAIRDRFPGTDTEHVWPEARGGNDTGTDRLWR